MNILLQLKKLKKTTTASIAAASSTAVAAYIFLEIKGQVTSPVVGIDTSLPTEKQVPSLLFVNH